MRLFVSKCKPTSLEEHFMHIEYITWEESKMIFRDYYSQRTKKSSTDKVRYGKEDRAQ